MSTVITETSAPVGVRRTGRRQLLHWVAVHSLGLALGLMFALPVVFVVLTGFMSDNQALTDDLWPRQWHPGNFVDVFDKAPMLEFFANSLLYSVTATAGMLLSGIPAAYALARLRWKGSNVGFMLVIAAMMLPPQVVAVPLFNMWADLGLTGTLWPLIVPYVLGDAFSIFLLRQFFLTIPQDYIDAARVDGCSEFRILYRVLLPMIRPGVAAASLFTFLYTWNDYFGPLLYTGTNEESWTLSLGLSMFRGLHKVDWNLTMAATVLTVLPVIVLFVFAQKAFIRGITFTGVKG